MPWLTRGLRRGIVTSAYPKRADGYGPLFSGAVTYRPGKLTLQEFAAAETACPTGAIMMDRAGPRLDRGRCILCGRCTVVAPSGFQFVSDFETSSTFRGRLVVPHYEGDDIELDALRQALASRVKALRRSVHLRHVDTGSDGSDEWEVAALTNPIYDVQRLGVFFTASPRHADILLATGVGSVGMVGPLRDTYEAMPAPKVVIAAGAEAISGGLVGEGYAAQGGIGGLLPVDVFVPGSPPSPFGLLYGILLAIGRLPGDQTPAPTTEKSRQRPTLRQPAASVAGEPGP
jgi:Ni,Fe-hydrogenase III small subunit/ferredoxin